MTCTQNELQKNDMLILKIKNIEHNFIYSINKWRSRTAEAIFKNRGHDTVRSAGINSWE
ncbi:hypothetical protein Oweho_2518 [Owenweeksia hongkongensis DSM 17368]|uniref:Uncharacterized protein n=1 Tax=Owenweeksia hongkongensis (strain DSM 17368 / CIP 108786 / JCM 12287 / NRRL B-23963 / UST20020801) TaxID=926562 RepID=G8R7V7_OWEHD|nr:hypothetical protein Oweho_2518 [Owenweeksia hongkongensis DSM 17368]